MTKPQPVPGSSAAEPPVWDATLVPDPAASGEDEQIEAVQPVVRSPVKVHPRRSGSVSLLLAISGLIAIGGISFAIGRATTGGTATTQSGTQGQFGPNASGLPGDLNGDGGRLAFSRTATVSGTVVSVSSDSITLKLADGSTVTVATGSSTTYHNQTTGSSADLAAGETVSVQTSGGSNVAPGASAATTTTRTATDVTITAG